jgi:HK97 family phage major capsid protein
MSQPVAVPPSNRIASHGIELTTEQVSRILVQPLEQASTFLASGVRIFDTTGPLRFPSAPDFDLTATPFTGESQLIPEAEATYDEISLMPSTMKSVKVITRFSNELARASVVSLDSVLQSRLVTEVAAKLDKQFYGSTGDGITEPKGMFGWTGTSSAPVGGALDLDAVLEAQGVLLAANANVNNLRLYLNPAQYIALRSEKATPDGRYQLQPDATESAGLRILGMPVTLSSFIPTGSAAIADPSQIAVARDASPSIKLLTERYADYDEQAIRVVSRYDVAPLNPKAVCLLTGITAPAASPPAGT